MAISCVVRELMKPHTMRVYVLCVVLLHPLSPCVRFETWRLHPIITYITYRHGTKQQKYCIYNIHLHNGNK